MKSCKLAQVIIVVTSFNADAVIVNNINGTNYEWLELTITQDLSRDQVEIRLADSNDALFGYQYASRSLVQELFLSYSPWDGVDGWHSTQTVVSGVYSLQSDFGFTDSFAGNGLIGSLTSVEGESALYDGNVKTIGLYGDSNECGGSHLSCRSILETLIAADGSLSVTSQRGAEGWDASNWPQSGTPSDSVPYATGSYLVREVMSPVPLPAAVWLFGSGLLGLIGIAKRKKYDD